MVVTGVPVAGVLAAAMGGRPAVARAVTGMGGVPVMRMCVAGPMPGMLLVRAHCYIVSFMFHFRGPFVGERRFLPSLIAENCLPLSFF